MSYPDYPKNRLIVNDVDLTETFKMVLADGYTLSPPSIKTYTVDIPGGNGTLDLTETLLGDTAYGNRKQEFIFYIIDAENFEKTKTDVSNLLHGRAFNYKITMDAEYSYHGRFEVTSYEHSVISSGILGSIKIAIDADPFKYKPEQVQVVNAVGGKIFNFESGRKRVRPVIETNGLLKVIFDGKLVTLPAGTWTIDDLFFTSGTNAVYLNSYSIHNLTWGDLKNDGVTWGQFKEMPLFEWYKSKATGNVVYKKWNEVSDMTWNNLSASTWSDLTYLEEIPDDIEDIKVKYEWGDL